MMNAFVIYCGEALNFLHKGLGLSQQAILYLGDKGFPKAKFASVATLAVLAIISPQTFSPANATIPNTPNGSLSGNICKS